jgi:hypothetical protein
MGTRNMAKLNICLMIGVSILLFHPLAGYGAVPQLIKYQAYLTDDVGNPLNDTVEITFSIYADAGGSTLLWTETHISVTVTGGIFNVILGSVTAFPEDLFDGDCYLGVAVGTDPEMTPRPQLTSVAYAIRACKAEVAESVMEGCIETVHLSDNVVSEEKIAGDAVTSDKIADGTLTVSDMDDGVALDEILDDDGDGSGLDADLLDGLDSLDFAASGHDHDGSYYTQAHIDALEARIAQLEALLLNVTRNGNDITFSGVNVQIVNGTGTTEGRSMGWAT